MFILFRCCRNISYVIVFFLVNGDLMSYSIATINTFLMLIVHFLSFMIVMFMNSSFGAINAFFMLKVFFLIGHDRDIHKAFSWFC
jgi:uncharacterized membrane-anchored protein YitT (DUF2179 family)